MRKDLHSGRYTFAYTGWQERWQPAHKTLAEVPMRRLGEMEDCAKVAEFFVTDLSDYVTGQCLSVCGGAIRFR